MRIAHLCLSNFYIDGRSYQENELVRQHHDAGHEVLVLASTETHSSEGKLAYVRPGDYDDNGVTIRRLPYRGWLPKKVMIKLRMHPGVYGELTRFAPDSILFHGTCGYELLAAARYAREHKHVRFYIDSHEDWNNSARTFVSREVLHRRFYGPILRKAAPCAGKILCVSSESIDFVHDLYEIPRDQLEWYPLGGSPVAPSEYEHRRVATRARLGLTDENKLFVQSGKQTRRKRLLEALSAFASVDDPDLRLVLVGVLGDDIRADAEPLIAADDRVDFVGWKNPAELTDLLCAADVYLQPGTQSATMQHSLCCHCAVILDNVPAHELYKNDNGWFIDATHELAKAVEAAAGSDQLQAMGERSFQFASERLDYRRLADRVFN